MIVCCNKTQHFPLQTCVWWRKTPMENAMLTVSLRTKPTSSTSMPTTRLRWSSRMAAKSTLTMDTVTRCPRPSRPWPGWSSWEMGYITSVTGWLLGPHSLTVWLGDWVPPWPCSAMSYRMSWVSGSGMAGKQSHIGHFQIISSGLAQDCSNTSRWSYHSVTLSHLRYHWLQVKPEFWT